MISYQMQDKLKPKQLCMCLYKVKGNNQWFQIASASTDNVLVPCTNGEHACPDYPKYSTLIYIIDKFKDIAMRDIFRMILELLLKISQTLNKTDGCE